MMKIRAVVIVAIALLAGCSGNAGGHPPATHANPSVSAESVQPRAEKGSVRDRRLVTAACAKFRSAASALNESGATNRAALQRFGHALLDLVTVGRSDPELGRDIGTAGAQALAIGLGVTPQGPTAASRTTRRNLLVVRGDCKGR
jgi:hypothetical protein